MKPGQVDFEEVLRPMDPLLDGFRNPEGPLVPFEEVLRLRNRSPILSQPGMGQNETTRIWTAGFGNHGSI